MIPPTIPTPRLTLIRLTDRSPTSQHLKWFHADWTDPDATSWSVRGASTSLAQSHARLVDALERDTLIYCVFENASTENTPGTHIGSIGLRKQDSGPTIPPLKRHAEDEGKELDLRILGYALFKSAWGKGYATEAAQGLLDAYAASVAQEKEKGDKVFYVEAGVDEENQGSWRVVGKLGFEKVGFRREEEAVFLGGKWRTEGYWVFGKYI